MGDEMFKLNAAQVVLHTSHVPRGVKGGLETLGSWWRLCGPNCCCRPLTEGSMR